MNKNSTAYCLRRFSLASLRRCFLASLRHPQDASPISQKRKKRSTIYFQVLCTPLRVRVRFRIRVRVRVRVRVVSLCVAIPLADDAPEIHLSPVIKGLPDGPHEAPLFLLPSAIAVDLLTVPRGAVGVVGVDGVELRAVVALVHVRNAVWALW